ncbi:hypothetical protein JNUCC0626_49230 [Lentzea sp. JNUCC 0626]|uniref:hypothetical protein n=1 Tax=Lentzea sp. JNUCC 0626 TaxID=3367513 RepID=UPI0037497765
MAGGFRVVALVLSLLVAGCGRGDDEIAALRQSIEAEMAAAPLPVGASLSAAEFDKGCVGFGGRAHPRADGLAGRTPPRDA